MAGSMTLDRMKHDLTAILTRIPAGRLVTHAALAERWNVPPRLVAQLVMGLGDAERRDLPWHRIVASGGAIGRHPWRHEQMARLLAEGVPVAPAGIVHQLAERAVRDLDHPASSPAPKALDTPPNRSRGMKSAQVTPRKG